MSFLVWTRLILIYEFSFNWFWNVKNDVFYDSDVKDIKDTSMDEFKESQKWYKNTIVIITENLLCLGVIASITYNLSNDCLKSCWSFMNQHFERQQ